MIVGLAVEYTGKHWQHHLAPPHNVSGALHRAIGELKLADAVVGLPMNNELDAAARTFGEDWQKKSRPPLDPRTGMVYMRAPMADNPVIYVRKVELWSSKAAQCFPQRQLYEVIADKDAEGGFVVKPVKKP